MRVISFEKLREFIEKHADADLPMRDWHNKTEKADWSSLLDIKETFNSVDFVGNDRYVFNIKGGIYRIVAVIIFKIKTVYLCFVGTHDEYGSIGEIKKLIG